MQPAHSPPGRLLQSRGNDLRSCRTRRASSSAGSGDDEAGGSRQQAADASKVQRGQQLSAQQLTAAGVSAGAVKLALSRASAAALRDPGRMLQAWGVLQEAIGRQQANALLGKPGGAYLAWNTVPSTLASKLAALRQGLGLDARQLGLVVAAQPGVLNLNVSRDLQPRLQQWSVLLGHEQDPAAVLRWVLRAPSVLHTLPPDAEARLSALAGLFTPPLSRQQTQRLVQQCHNFAVVPVHTLRRKLGFLAAELEVSDQQLAKLTLQQPNVISLAEASVAAKLRQLAMLLGVPASAVRAAIVAQPVILVGSAEALAARHAAAAAYAARSDGWQVHWQDCSLAWQLNLSARLGSRSARLEYLLAEKEDTSTSLTALKHTAADFHRRFPGYRDWRAASGLPREEADGRLRSRLLPPAEGRASPAVQAPAARRKSEVHQMSSCIACAAANCASHGMPLGMLAAQRVGRPCNEVLLLLARKLSACAGGSVVGSQSPSALGSRPLDASYLLSHQHTALPYSPPPGVPAGRA